MTMPQRLSDIPLADLVPEIRKWNGGKGIDLYSWIQCVGTIETAIAFGELFWPEFTAFDGCIFFASFSELSYRGFLEQCTGNKNAVEAVMNHRHIVDLFAQEEPRPAKEQVIYLGRLLKEIWAAKLHRDFPECRIVVSFPEGPFDDLLDYEITFYQE
jgi:hypothetical protein